MASGLTLLTALSLWLFGGDVLNGFSFALVVGILVGTYSSVFVACPILIYWYDLLENRRKQAIGLPTNVSPSGNKSTAPVVKQVVKDSSASAQSKVKRAR